MGTYENDGGEMKDRMLHLEETVGYVREGQSAIKQSLIMMSETLKTLTDVRAETLHIMKQQETITRDHIEFDSRLRLSESQMSSHKEIIKAAHDDIAGLQFNQRWAATSIIVIVSGLVLRKLFTLL